MDPDDLARLDQWLASLNRGGVDQPLTGDDPWLAVMGHADPSQPGGSVQAAEDPSQQEVYWPDIWQGGDAGYTPEDYANALTAHVAMSRGSSGPSAGPGTPNPQAAGQLQQLGDHSDSRLSADAPYTPQDYADALVAAIGRGGGAASQPGGGPANPAAAGTSQALPTAQDLIGTPDSSPMLDWGRQMSDQGRGTSPSPWKQDAPLQIPPGVGSQAAPPLPVGTHGYNPAKGDESLLARVIYAEGAGTPDDFGALGWSVVNRVGAPGFGNTLNDVIHQPGQFTSVKGGGSRLWRETADPSKLTGIKATRFRQAQQVAQGILGGSIADPTGGAPYFFASQDLDGDAAKAAPSSWKKGFANGAYVPSQYQGHIGVADPQGHRTRNYFALKGR